MIYFTSICANYLPKAMVLAESLKRHNPDARFVLCLVERHFDYDLGGFSEFDEIILARECGIDAFDSFMFRHNIVEASTAVKPHFMIHLMKRYPDEDKFVYLDPDIKVYGRFDDLKLALEEHSIALTPHLLFPGNIDMEISSLAHGIFNLGFLAIRRSDNAAKFLRWWADRLYHFCYDDKIRGIFTDQKWINLAPCFFDCHLIKHQGYNFATWSLMGSNLVEHEEKYLSNGDPLCFIHFSGLDSGIVDKAVGWWLTPENSATFLKLLSEYRVDLDEHGQATLGKIAWSYGRYTNGESISQAARLAYRNSELWQGLTNPFDASDSLLVGSENPSQTTSSGEVEQNTHSILRRIILKTRRFNLRRMIG